MRHLFEPFSQQLLASRRHCRVVPVPGVSPAAAESAQEMQAAAERTMQELERVRDNPLALRDFLKRMPKGADLHNHLHSAVYAETFIGGHRRRSLRGSCQECVRSTSSCNGRRAASAASPAATVYKDLRLHNGLTDSSPCAASCRQQRTEETMRTTILLPSCGLSRSDPRAVIDRRRRYRSNLARRAPG